MAEAKLTEAEALRKLQQIAEDEVAASRKRWAETCKENGWDEDAEKKS